MLLDFVDFVEFKFQLPENLIPTLDEYFRKNYKGRADEEDEEDEEEAPAADDDDEEEQVNLGWFRDDSTLHSFTICSFILSFDFFSASSSQARCCCCCSSHFGCSWRCASRLVDGCQASGGRPVQ